MVATSTTAVVPTTTITDNGSMLLYNSSGTSSAAASDGGIDVVGGTTSCNTTATLEQYHLQLYNYALNMERLREAPYTAAAAMAAAAAYASTTTVSTTTINCPPVHCSKYSGTNQGSAVSASQTSYLCATAADNLIAATSHMERSQLGLRQCPTNNRLALASMSLFPQHIFQPEEPKPQHSYIGLIAMAILSSAERKLVLSDIYQYILENYPYFRTRGPGWRNSIRHNLSLNDCFIKSGRSANGKGHYWAIHPANMDDFRKGDFRRRKAQRKVRKHMGLALDDNSTDSPSPPPAMDLTSPQPPPFQRIVMDNSTLTPLATAAQHLAAQSFGWYFTQHHRQQQQQHHQLQQAGTRTAASYVGQIFAYRPQHYVTAAAAAAVLCHSGNKQQQNQQHQQLISPNSNHLHHQPSQTTESSVPQQSLILSSQSSIATNVHVNVINELFSQRRKRQFDVASLLAPDYSNKRERDQHQQYIRNHTTNESETDMRPSSCNEDIGANATTQNDVEIEDIDVVEASEDEDIEADYDHDDEDEEANSDSNSCSLMHSHSYDDEEGDYIRRFTNEYPLRLNSNHCKISKTKMPEAEEEKTACRVRRWKTDDNDGEPDDRGDDDKNNNQEEHSLYCEYKNDKNLLKSSTSLRINGFQHSNMTMAKTIALTTKTSPSPPPPRHPSHLLNSAEILEQSNNLKHQSQHHHQHQHHHPPPPLNAEAHHLFGCYYGTYMAAAAAKLNSSIPHANIIGNID